MRRPLSIALFVTAAICAQAQYRVTLNQTPAQSNSPTIGMQSGIGHGSARFHHNPTPVVITGGTGMRARFDFAVQERNLRIFTNPGGRVTNRWGKFVSRGPVCYRAYCGGSYFYNPYYAMPVYFESNNGPDFNAQPSAYSVYGGDVPKEYMAPGAAAVEAAYRQGQLDARVTSLADEVARLRAEKAEREAQDLKKSQPDRSFADANTANANDPAQGPSTAATATLVFRSGRRMDIGNYGIVGKTLWVFDEQRARKIPLNDLDLEATRKVNAENGFEFKIPQASR